MSNNSVPIVDTVIPNWESWGAVRSYINREWDPQNHPHHAVIGLTGSGKSYLAIKGILSLCDYDRVLIVDCKGNDPLVRSVGNPVYEIPKDSWRVPWYTRFMGKQDKPRQFWYRLVVDDDPDKARPQVANALRRAYSEGNWVIYFDEFYDITAARKPNLNLGPLVEQIYRKGRSRNVSIIGATQSPAWVPRVFYDQAAFAWIGRIRDEDRQKRLLEIGGMSKKELPYISTLKSREWLLSAKNGEYFARTIVRV